MSVGIFHPMDELCWYCGSRERAIAAIGNAIGNMVYSSDITPSLNMIGEYLGTFPAMTNEVNDHLLRDRMQICDECLTRLFDQVKGLPKEYIDNQLHNYDLQRSEVADFDTCLISWDDRHYPYGCWLQCFPDTDVMQKFQSLELGELFRRGLRFHGKVLFGREEFVHFLQRFATGTCIASHEFLEHVAEHIIISDGQSFHNFAKVRAVIYDVSIWNVKQPFKSGDEISQS